MKEKTVRIGSRGSKLALWQAEWVQAQLQSQGLLAEITIIKTKGDKILDVPLAKVGGKGLFVKEIEDALLEHQIDLAVHSMKDMPGEMPEGLKIGAIPQRENPCDALIARDNNRLETLPQGAIVGTSSLRRQAQLLTLRPDLKIVSLRGNLDTRLRKLKAGDFDAILLAAAGLHRLEWGDEITETLSPQYFVPAIAQGALCIQSRENDAEINGLIQFLNHSETAATVSAERAMLARLEGGCQVPIGGHATLVNNQITLDGLVASLDGKKIIREKQSAAPAEAKTLGVTVAEALLEKGAKTILDDIYSK